MLALTLFLSAALAAQQNPEDGRGQGLFPREWHAGRRAALMALDQMKDGVVILRGVGQPNDYRALRQDNEFWYFTGVTTPSAVLVLVPKEQREILFVPPVDPGMEVWLGDLIDAEEAERITGIGEVRDLSELEATLKDLSGEYKTFLTPMQPAENWMMSRDNLQMWAASVKQDPFDGRSTREQQFAARLKEKFGVTVKDVTVTLDALRVVKTPPEVAAMRRAAQISGQGHAAAMAQGRAGMYEWELGAIMTSEFLRRGAAGAAYLAIVGSGPNACILHYPEAKRQTQDGDLVLIDYGAEFNYFVADVTRTWPVNGKFSARQREIYQAVYDAQEAAFRECKPGSNLGKVDRAARKVIQERGFGAYFNHGTSHWLGMATHDVGAPMTAFVPGCAFTVEPGIYIPEESVGVRIEDIVVITESGYDLLTAGIPRSVEEVEAVCRR